MKKSVIVTGISRGVGRVTATLLAAKGAGLDTIMKKEAAASR